MNIGGKKEEEVEGGVNGREENEVMSMEDLPEVRHSIEKERLVINVEGKKDTI